jgi:hypothetical protein
MSKVVLLRGMLAKANGRRLKFSMPEEEGNHRTRFKLIGLGMLYPGKSPVHGEVFYVNDKYSAQVMRAGEIVDSKSLVGADLTMWTAVRQYKRMKDGVTQIGWCLDLKKMTLD